ncbi:hypothetical protein J4227_01610 [Candidatus Woesearchaeota archaeon]|nr:hypothetical protein [Candidatus Woesearchaeota archaeon]
MALKNKKAQMEILGIAVIVVFLALGIFFIVKFNILNEPESAKKVYTQSELASNTISAMLETTAADCSNLKLLDIIIDCADFYSSDGDIVCNTAGGVENRSCSYARHTMDYMLSSTLEYWEKNYVFNVTTLSGSSVFPVYGRAYGKCAGEKRHGQFFFQTGTGTMLVQLDVCS